jgi:hypothetical protein
MYVKKEITVDPRNQYYDSRENCNALIETASNTLLLGNDYTKIPETVSTLAGSCFEDCTFTEFEVPNNITYCEDIFTNCKNLKTVIWNSTYTDMNPSYNDCFRSIRKQLEHLVINVSEIPRYLLVDMPNLQTVTLGSECVEQFYFDHDRHPFYSPQHYVVDVNNPVYDSRNNCDAIIYKEGNLLVLGCANTVIPDTVTAVAGGAFRNVSFDNTFVIPSHVELWN